MIVRSEIPDHPVNACLEWQNHREGRTRVYWRLGRSTVGESVLWFVSVFLILPLVAAVLLGVGSGTISVHCDKAPGRTDCTIREGFLLDAYVRTRQARDVQRANIATYLSDEGDAMSRPVLETATGKVPLEWASSNFGYYGKRAFIDQLNSALTNTNAKDFQFSVSKWNVFGYLGLFVALLFKWAVAAKVAYWLFPVFLEMNSRERTFRFRLSSLFPVTQTWPFRDAKVVGLTRYVGIATLFMEAPEGKRVLIGKGYAVEKAALEPLDTPPKKRTVF